MKTLEMQRDFVASLVQDMGKFMESHGLKNPEVVIQSTSCSTRQLGEYQANDYAEAMRVAAVYNEGENLHQVTVPAFYHRRGGNDKCFFGVWGPDFAYSASVKIGIEFDYATRWYYVVDELGIGVTKSYWRREDAEKSMAEFMELPDYKGRTFGVSNVMPWEFAPAAWAMFVEVQTLDQLAEAALAYPGEWNRATELLFNRFHPISKRWGIVSGIAYNDFSTLDGGVVVKNPLASRPGTADLFIWDRTTGLNVNMTSKNGREWDLSGFRGQVTPRPIYYFQAEDGIRPTFTNPQDKAVIPSTTLSGNNIPEPVIVRASTEFSRLVDADLNNRYPLLWGFSWENGIPKENGAENYFKLLENDQRREELWLEPYDASQIKVGNKIWCRERGGLQSVTIREIAKNSRSTRVRGEWSEGAYLRVEEFLARLGAVADVAAHRKFGDPGWRGSLV